VKEQVCGVVTNSAATETYLYAAENGAVQLKYDNSTKLATTATGIDVTGTVTADGLTVDDIDLSATGALESVGTIFIDIDKDNSSTTAALKITADGQAKNVAWFQENGDISFYEDTGTTAKFFWDASAESLGIGTTAPSTDIHIKATGTTGSVFVEANNALYKGQAVGNANYRFTIGSYFANESFALLGGNDYKLITATGFSTPDTLIFHTSNTERSRIDSNGNLLVGKTGAGSSNVGVEARPEGYLFATGDNITPLRINRLNTGGAIVDLQKDGTTIGRAGSFSDDLYLGTNETGLRFYDASDNIFPFNTTTLSNTDGATSLGGGAQRFKDLYLSGGVYLGGTGAANLLDDYEEGTWTVTLSDDSGNDSPTTATGNYIKIGNQVTAVFSSLNDIDTTGMVSTDNVRISLPFAVTNQGSGSIVHHGLDINTRTQLNIVALTSNFARLMASGDTLADVFLEVGGITSGADDITQCTVTYFTS
jgi:hypothetical protein